MPKQTLQDIRKETAARLLAYRKDRERLRKHLIRTPEERERAQRWICAVEVTRAVLRRAMPDKERAMTRLFGLDTPIPRSRAQGTQVIRLAMDLNLSESTLYKWREEIILVTMCAAIEAGALSPFGLRHAVRPADATAAKGGSPINAAPSERSARLKGLHNESRA